MSSPIGRPRSSDADVAILRAARDLLDEVGYDGLTMESVAERAGTGKQTLYRRWPRKPLLVFAARLGGAEAVEPQIPDTGSFARDLASVTAEQERVYAIPGMLDLVRGLLGDCLAEPDLLDELRERFLRPRLQVLERVVTRARERGEVTEDLSASTIARTIAGAMFAGFVIFGGANASFASELAVLAERGARPETRPA